MSESGTETAGGRGERRPPTPALDDTRTGEAAGRNHRRFGFQPKSKGGGTPGRRRYSQGLRRAQQPWSQREGEEEEEEEDDDDQQRQQQQRRSNGQTLTPSLIPRQGSAKPRRPDAPRGVGPAAGTSVGTSADVSGDDESGGFWASAREGTRSSARGPPQGGGAGALATKEAVFLAGAGQRSSSAGGIRAVAEGGGGVHEIDRVPSSSEGEGLERHELRVALVRIKRLERGWEQRSSAFEVRVWGTRRGGGGGVTLRDAACSVWRVACGTELKRYDYSCGVARFCCLYIYIVSVFFFASWCTLTVSVYLSPFIFPLGCG